LSVFKFVYVASPYTKGDVAVNVRKNLEAADKLARFGYVPFAPLLTHFWHLLFPHEYEFWCELDNAWVEKCDCLVRLPGESSGADKEVALAKSLGIPVYFADNEFSIGEFREWEAPYGSP
jgi:hypothetical protein